MKRAFALAGVLSLVAPHATFAAASEWKVDPSHSNAAFSVKHLGVATVRGDIHAVSGTLWYDDKDVTKSRIEVSIDAKAIQTGVEHRDNDLRGANFLDVEKFPTITFKSTSIKKGAMGKLEMKGNLTLHGVTKEVTLTVDGPTEPVEMMGTQAMGASATTMILRKDYGVSWNAMTEAGNLVASNEVNVYLDMEFHKVQKETAKEAAPAKRKGGW